MASEHDRSPSAPSNSPSEFIDALPPHPSLEMQQKRAKNLLRAASRGNVDAWRRIRALHPKPPSPDDREAFKLADAQLVIARGYGFESWAAMRRKILSLTKTPIEQFHAALHASDTAQIRALLETHAEVRAAVNKPVSGTFGARPYAVVRKNLDALDTLLEYGADINLKSDWWAGPFSPLEFSTPEEAAPLIARGAIVDIVAASHLGMFDRVRELIESDPSLVHARGGDGQTPLHYARDIEIARYLVEHGADIDARDVDHGSTAAQWLVRKAPDVARFLVDRGAWFDIFIAVGLRDAALVERCLRDDPEALDHRTGQGKYIASHNGRPSERKDIGEVRGDTYRWVFGHNVTVMDAARILGFDDMVALLERHATPVQRLLAACAAADRRAAEAVVAAHPGVVQTLTREQMRLMAYKAHASNDTAAVLLMLDIGFDARVPGPDELEPIRWAVFHGNVEMTRALLRHNPPINTPDPSYGGTLLANCLYGAHHGWHADTGDYVTTAQLLLAAGERVDPSWLPLPDDDLDALIRAHIHASSAG